MLCDHWLAKYSAHHIPRSRASALRPINHSTNQLINQSINQSHDLYVYLSIYLSKFVEELISLSNTYLLLIGWVALLSCSIAVKSSHFKEKIAMSKYFRYVNQPNNIIIKWIKLHLLCTTISTVSLLIYVISSAYFAVPACVCWRMIDFIPKPSNCNKTRT